MSLNLVNLAVACITCVIVCNFRLALLIPNDEASSIDDEDNEKDDDDDDDHNHDDFGNIKEKDEESLMSLPL